MFISDVAWSKEPLFRAITKQDRTLSGQLSGGEPTDLRFTASDGTAISLDRLQLLELPIATRRFPDRGWKQLRMHTGDVLHARLHADINAQTAVKWLTGFGAPIRLPFSALASVSHPPGTRCLVYHDFETTVEGWTNQSGMPMLLSQERGRSGSGSLKLSNDQTAVTYQFDKRFTSGWVEFAFFVAPDPQGQCDVIATFGLSDGQKSSALDVTLLGHEAWYACRTQNRSDWQAQRIVRRPGWHVLTLAIHPGSIQLLIDDYLLASGTARKGDEVTTLEIAASKDAQIWLDDFAITSVASETKATVIQMDRDQVDLVSGDQLFGNLAALDVGSVTLEVNGQQSRTPWSEIDRLQLAQRSAPSSSVAGWIVNLDLQPQSSPPESRSTDSIRGALLAVNEESCQFQHAVLGELTIPWTAVRRIRPSHRGQLLVVEGRAQHLGNEIKSAFEVPVPGGARLKRGFDLEQLPRGTAFVSIAAVDLEPSGKGTREHPHLRLLAAGELTSELWLNEQRIGILNQQVTGRGSHQQPQRLRIKLPPSTLHLGHNQFEFRLQPTRQEPAEYDDWELVDLAIEVEQ